MKPSQLSIFLSPCFLVICVNSTINEEIFDKPLESIQILSPGSCDDFSPTFIYLIHSAPQNVDKRNGLRKTWAHPNKWFHSKRVFFIGRSPNAKEEDEIREESKIHGDIFFYDMVDSYFNMTIKVLFKNNVHRTSLKSRHFFSTRWHTDGSLKDVRKPNTF